MMGTGIELLEISSAINECVTVPNALSSLSIEGTTSIIIPVATAATISNDSTIASTLILTFNLCCTNPTKGCIRYASNHAIANGRSTLLMLLSMKYDTANTATTINMRKKRPKVSSFCLINVLLFFNRCVTILTSYKKDKLTTWFILGKMFRKRSESSSQALLVQF